MVSSKQIDRKSLKEQLYRTSKVKGCAEFRQILKTLTDANGKPAISHIVLRYENNRWNLASYVSFYVPTGGTVSEIQRPLFYALADVENGELTEVYDCRNHDFSDEPYVLYKLDNAHKGPQEEYDEAYTRMDKARQYLIETNDPKYYMKPYRDYMDCILRYTPVNYRRFFYSLSSIDVSNAPDKTRDAAQHQPETAITPLSPAGTSANSGRNASGEAGVGRDGIAHAESDTAYTNGSPADKPAREPSPRARDDEAHQTRQETPAHARKDAQTPAWKRADERRKEEQDRDRTKRQWPPYDPANATAEQRREEAKKRQSEHGPLTAGFSVGATAEAGMGRGPSASGNVFDAMADADAAEQTPEHKGMRPPRNGRERRRQNDRSAEGPEQVKQGHDKALQRVFGDDPDAVLRVDEQEKAEPKAQAEAAGSHTNAAQTEQTVRETAGKAAQSTGTEPAKNTPPTENQPAEAFAAEQGFDEESSSDRTKIIPPDVMQRITENARKKLASWRASNVKRDTEGANPDTGGGAAGAAPADTPAAGTAHADAPDVKKQAADEPFASEARAMQEPAEMARKAANSTNAEEAVSSTGQEKASQKWKPKENLSELPDRYFHIAERIADMIVFLPERDGNIRFQHPAFCFQEDSLPDADPWLVMQAKLMHADVRMRKHEVAPEKTIYTTCTYRDRCLFNVCPYVTAAYIRYLKDNDPEELEAQREAYRANKRNVDAEGYPGYIMGQPKYIHYSDESIREAADWIDRGLFGVVRKNGSTNVFVVTYASYGRDHLPDTDACMNGNGIRELTSILIKKNELEHKFVSKGFLRSINGTRTPNGVDVMVYADYLIRTGKLPEGESAGNGDDMITYTF